MEKMWKWQQPNSKCYPAIHLEGQRKTMTNINQKNHSPGQDKNWEHPKHKSGVSLLQQTGSNRTWISTTDFQTILKYIISWKSIQWESLRQMNMMKLIVTFHNFGNMPKNKCTAQKKTSLHFQKQPSVTATQQTEHKANKKTEEAEEEE